MTKEMLAVLGFVLTLVAAVFAFGLRIGTLTERVEAQTKQIELLSGRVESLSDDWAGSRVEMMRILAAR